MPTNSDLDLPSPFEVNRCSFHRDLHLNRAGQSSSTLNPGVGIISNDLAVAAFNATNDIIRWHRLDCL